ncbi:MAG: hypothetical protein ABFR53_09165 [Actinomycetota bacterium]
MSGQDGKFADLMRSPYEDDDRQREGESDLAWKPPVIAAILGALLVGAFVIYSIVAGPADDPEEASSAPTDTAAAQSTDLPEGFTPFPSGNGARIEAVTPVEGSQYVAVSTAVSGSEAASEVAPDEIAYWELQTDAGTVPMREQLSALGVLGNTSVVLEVDGVPGGSQLLAYVVSDVTERTSVIEAPLDDGSPETDFSIEIEPGVSVNGVVSIGEGWGHLVWSLEGGIAAKVDVVVTFVGTDDPSSEGIHETQLIPGHHRTLSQGIGAIESAPLYGFDGSYQLYRVGEPLSSANEPTSLLLEFTADVVVAVSDPVVIGPLPGS